MLLCQKRLLAHAALLGTQQLCVRVRVDSDFVGWQHAPSCSCAFDVASQSILSIGPDYSAAKRAKCQCLPTILQHYAPPAPESLFPIQPPGAGES